MDTTSPGIAEVHEAAERLAAIADDSAATEALMRQVADLLSDLRARNLADLSALAASDDRPTGPESAPAVFERFAIEDADNHFQFAIFQAITSTKENNNGSH